MSADTLLQLWRDARQAADRRHREELEQADRLYEQWRIAQAAEATKGATLPTATWEDRFTALQVLGGDASVRMRKPGDWYVSQEIGISDGVIVGSSYGNGITPQEAVEDHWRIYTNVPEGSWIAVGRGDERINALWDGDGWKTWTPVQVSS